MPAAAPSDSARPGSRSARAREPGSGVGRSDWVEVGQVLSTRGRDGELLVGLYGDDPANALAAPRLRLDGDPGALEFAVVEFERRGAARDGSARVSVKLEGLTESERASAWIGAVMSILEADLEPLPDGEYYWRDLLGLTCITTDGERLGVVEEIWPTGSNDVLVVRGAGCQLLIPALREVVLSVDPDAGELRVLLPEGLREEGA
jgi:16S rRNA processing protein RimM